MWWLTSVVPIFICVAFIPVIYSLVQGGIGAPEGVSKVMLNTNKITPKLVTISEHVWRREATKHTERIRSLLQPGLTTLDHPLNSGRRRSRGVQKQHMHDWTALDPHNPIYNFLIEYYGIKGAKGPRRLARWSPDPSVLLYDKTESMDVDGDEGSSTLNGGASNKIYEKVMEVTNGLGGILLENANENDMGGTLHLRGAIPIITNQKGGENGEMGILYNPAIFYERESYSEDAKAEDDADELITQKRRELQKKVAPFQWYASILRTTLNSDPIFHCHGLHEWAMQYHPEGEAPPPSAKYQSVLPLRVSREVINETVERKGISCTHVDALRFFAPAAGPLNHHGSSLERTDQLRLEQKACVHAHMDLLKIALKLGPFIDTELLGDVLEISLAARKLDVEASPYDASAYGAGIVPVETSAGRKIYRDRQRELMNVAEPVRIRLLEAYDVVMKLGFDDDLVKGSLPLLPNSQKVKRTKETDDDYQNTNTSQEMQHPYADKERFARAEPGGLPWRQNLIKS